jgi:hypothetical protein
MTCSALGSSRRAAQIKRGVDFLAADWGDFFYPAHRPGNIAMTRQRRYVKLELASKPWPKRYRLWDVRKVTLRWTSEAHVATPVFFTRLEQALAQALGIPYAAGVFERTEDWARDRVTFERARRARVPDHLAAIEELGDGR